MTSGAVNHELDPAFDEQMKKLHVNPFYHGLRSRTEIENDLRGKGDYLIRLIKSKKKEVVLSVCVGSAADGSKVIHVPITFNSSSKTWELTLIFTRKPRGKASNRSTTVDTPSGQEKNSHVRKHTFQSLDDLVKHYKRSPISSGVLLRTGIKRPKWLIPSTSITFDPVKDFLGKGNFCMVVKGQYKYRKDKEKKAGVCTVAVKMLLDEVDAGDLEMEKDEGRESMFREASIMAKCRHRNVIAFHGVACDVPPVMIVMEFCPGGSLETHLQREKEHISDSERILFCMEAARGMRYLHHNNFVHRDLATRNCLISANGMIKISDFGLSKRLTEKSLTVSEKRKETALNVPLRWMAPEAISKTPDFSTKSDVWSFGVLVYEVWNFGIKPWPNEEDNKKILVYIKRGQMPDPPEKTPPAMKEIMKKCWHEKPSERPDFREIIKLIVCVQKSGVKYRWPKSSECSVNRIPGVRKEECGDVSTEELLQERSILVLNSDQRTPPMSRNTSEETVSRETVADSKDSAEEVRGQRCNKGSHEEVIKDGKH